jgi:hypothetical protein
MSPQPVPKICRRDVDKSVEVRLVEIVSTLFRSNELLNASDLGIVLVISSVLKMCWKIPRLYNFCGKQCP